MALVLSWRKQREPLTRTVAQAATTVARKAITLVIAEGKFILFLLDLHTESCFSLQYYFLSIQYSRYKLFRKV